MTFVKVYNSDQNLRLQSKCSLVNHYYDFKFTCNNDVKYLHFYLCAKLRINYLQIISRAFK